MLEKNANHVAKFQLFGRNNADDGKQSPGEIRVSVACHVVRPETEDLSSMLEACESSIIYLGRLSVWNGCAKACVSIESAYNGTCNRHCVNPNASFVLCFLQAQFRDVCLDSTLLLTTGNLF